MLKKLFRPKWQHENLEVRKTAVTRLGSADDHILHQIALNDNDSAIRQLAISRIEKLATLENILAQATSADDQAFALKCWVSVLGNSGQLSPIGVEQYIIDCQNEKLLSGIIVYGDNDNWRDLALCGLNKEEQLLALMGSTKNSRIWQTIIEKLASEDALKKAGNIVNGRDKKSQHLIKGKHDAIKAHQQAVRSKEEHTNHLVERLQHLLSTESNPLFEGILLAAKQQWATLGNDLAEDKNALIKNLIEQCETRLHTHQKKDAKAETVIAPENPSPDQAIQALQQQLFDGLHELQLSALTGSTPAADLKISASNINAKWQETIAALAEKELHLYNRQLSSVNHIIHAIEIIEGHDPSRQLNAEQLSHYGFNETRQLIKDLQQAKTILEKSGVTRGSSLEQVTESLLARAITHKTTLQETAEKLHHEIRNNIKAVDDFIDKKDLKNAQKIAANIRKALVGLPDNESKTYNSSTQRIFQAIHSLEDWKNYADDEKRAELCEKMQKLIDDNSDLAAKAQLIKQMQQQWKALGHCPNQALWKQFKAYADTAYLPCQNYFNAQKQLRRFNAEQRTIICEQLEHFIQIQDWHDTDWKALEKLFRTIQDEWKKYAFVAHEDYAPLQNRFMESSNILKEKIQNERQANNAKMAMIVQKAQDLIQAADIHSAIEEYSKLQQQWKTVGITFHKEQHEQWLAFKKAGDTLYEKRQNLRHEADHERLDNLQTAKQICNDIIRLGELPMDELANSRPEFEALKTAFKTLGPLPRDEFKPCLQTFNQACDAYENRISQIDKHEWRQQLQNLELLAEEFLTLESSGKEPDLRALTSATLIPEKWLTQLQQRFIPADANKAREHATLLCIEMEMLAQTETPAQDAALKMQWQMTNLAKKFGKAHTQSETDQITDLYLRWFSQTCWNEAEYKLLQQRFLESAKTLV